MATNKRVTILIELVDTVKDQVVWSYQETNEHSTGDNPLHHWSDAEVAGKQSLNHGLQALRDRFGDFRDL